MSLSCLVVALLLILLKNTSHVNTLEQNISNHSKDSNYLHHKEGTTIYVVFFLLNCVAVLNYNILNFLNNNYFIFYNYKLFRILLKDKYFYFYFLN